MELFLALLALGLVSGVHCTGMCGGIVIAFSAQPLIDRKHLWKRQLAMNLGRIGAYTALGAMAGGLGAALLAGAAGAQAALLVAANLVLVLVGLHLAGLFGAIARLERLGAPLWRRLQPLAARLFTRPSLPATFLAGSLWGLLPCGLVYGALAVSVASGGAVEGAAAMAGFGLGTLPWLLAAGVAAARLRAWISRPWFRMTAGGTVLAFGAWGLAHAGNAAGPIQTLLCL